ncbi:helix-turn-helix transcriptional regulator [Pseudochrobactrum asaccharolyticum]|jgi:DNA-binding CsgD family transcriptional regulator|uniref:Regulatory LuxR family protein n=1 Tax=Pseudochrobactrum asaccharolyticum TaxID=354351 RepID=A0A366E2D8_9HYPH|nr:response regulator transcription factor [Pseudochrobactrum asaccharolyticum]MDR2310263.1 response regulator transcription factor [Brucellaceae bacterium]RBO95684.1 regulatory LuxR family protein [Pseudochrobactrum asaccharolyticum]
MMYRAADLSCVRMISSIIADTAPPSEKAELVLDELFRLIPYAAAQICTWDEHKHTHFTVAARGYSTTVRTALNGAGYRDDIVWPFLEKNEGAVFWKDCPFNRDDSPFYSRFLAPQGYREGGTVLLRSAKGHYAGMLMMNLETYQAPAETEQALLGIVGAGLTPLVDRFHHVRRLAAICAPQRAAIVYHNLYGWIDISGDGLPPEAFLQVVGVPDIVALPVRSNWRDPAMSYSRKRSDRGTIIAYEIYPLHDQNCEILLTWARETSPHQLTARETEVLAALTQGLSNTQIGRKLGVSTRTVSTHVERILDKLDVPTRAAAASIAVRMGLAH